MSSTLHQRERCDKRENAKLVKEVEPFRRGKILAIFPGQTSCNRFPIG
jgi:hypothetical protein